MKENLVRLLVGAAIAVSPGLAGTVTQVGSDSESNLFNSVGYNFHTNGSNSVQTAACSPTNIANMQTTSGISCINYLSLVPGGSTISRATLDVDCLFDGPSVTNTPTFSCTGSGCGLNYFTPVFSATLGAYTVAI